MSERAFEMPPEAVPASEKSGVHKKPQEAADDADFNWTDFEDKPSAGDDFDDKTGVIPAHVLEAAKKIAAAHDEWDDKTAPIPKELLAAQAKKMDAEATHAPAPVAAPEAIADAAPEPALELVPEAEDETPEISLNGFDLNGALVETANAFHTTYLSEKDVIPTEVMIKGIAEWLAGHPEEKQTLDMALVELRGELMKDFAEQALADNKEFSNVYKRTIKEIDTKIATLQKQRRERAA